MANSISMYELILDLAGKQWKVSRLADQTLIGPMQYGWDRFQKDSNSMTFGGGLLASSSLAGTRRMIFTGYSPAWEGFYALQRCLFEKYKAEYTDDWFRILAVGPGARYTKEGAIGSNQIRKGELSSIDDWAGRGGLGSRLLQYHHVAGIVFGGDWQDPSMREQRAGHIFHRTFWAAGGHGRPGTIAKIPLCAKI
jgi:aldehyde:ferredoxin oxidoreductase